jgi:hypothetical protein
MRKHLHNIVERYKSMREGRRGTQYEIVWNEREVAVKWLTMENETGSVSFLWDSVSAVDTFKRDQLTVDCICMAFQTDDGWIEVNEDMKDWDSFLKAVELRFPGFPPQKAWWGEVILPPFETKHSRLWTRKTAEQGAEADRPKSGPPA